MSEDKEESLSHSNVSEHKAFLLNDNFNDIHTLQTQMKILDYAFLKKTNESYSGLIGGKEVIKEIMRNERMTPNGMHKGNYLDSNLELEVCRIELYQPANGKPKQLALKAERVCNGITQKPNGSLNAYLYKERQEAKGRAIHWGNQSRLKPNSLFFAKKVESVLRKRILKCYFIFLKEKPQRKAKRGECKDLIKKIERIQLVKSIKRSERNDFLLYRNKKLFVKHHYYSKCSKTFTLLKLVVAIQSYWRKYSKRLLYKSKLKSGKQKTKHKSASIYPKSKDNKDNKRIDHLFLKRIPPYSIIKASSQSNCFLNQKATKIQQRWKIKAFNKQQLKAKVSPLQRKNPEETDSLFYIYQRIDISISYITKATKSQNSCSGTLLNHNLPYLTEFINNINSFSKGIKRFSLTQALRKLASYRLSHNKNNALISTSNTLPYQFNRSKREHMQFIYSIGKILTKNLQEKVFYYLFCKKKEMTSVSFYFNSIRNHLQLISDFKSKTQMANDIESKFPVRIALSHYYTQANSLNFYSLYFDDKSREEANEVCLLKDIFNETERDKLTSYMCALIDKHYSEAFNKTQADMKETISHYLSRLGAINTSIFGISRLIEGLLRMREICNENVCFYKPNRGNINIILNQIIGENKLCAFYQTKSVCDCYTVSLSEKQFDLDSKTKKFSNICIDGTTKQQLTNKRKELFYYSTLNRVELNQHLI